MPPVAAKVTEYGVFSGANGSGEVVVTDNGVAALAGHANSGHGPSYHANNQERCCYGREKPAGKAAGEVRIS